MASESINTIRPVRNSPDPASRPPAIMATLAIDSAAIDRPVGEVNPAAAAIPGMVTEGRYRRLKVAIEAEIDAAIGQAPGRNAELAEAMRYAVLGGGKRFRAALAASVCEMVGGMAPGGIRVGAAIECVHAQSLVHDDLPCMDDDDLRRGRPTLHRRFDEATAVLAGDALLALSFEILAGEATHPDPAVRAGLVLALARAVGQDGLAGGQMMDLYPAEQQGMQDVLECEQRKTGALIRFAVEAGTMLGSCNAEERGRLLRFADILGLLFQIRDDVLDVVGDAAVVGKAVGKDAAAGRRSMTVEMGLDGANHHAARLVEACRAEIGVFGPRAQALEELLQFAATRTH